MYMLTISSKDDGNIKVERVEDWRFPTMWSEQH
jgi:hypothetical protein